jgi:hypothetical protein
VKSTVLSNVWPILCHEAVQINQPNDRIESRFILFTYSRRHRQQEKGSKANVSTKLIGTPVNPDGTPAARHAATDAEGERERER